MSLANKKGQSPSKNLPSILHATSFLQLGERNYYKYPRCDLLFHEIKEHIAPHKASQYQQIVPHSYLLKSSSADNVVFIMNGTSWEYDPPTRQAQKNYREKVVQLIRLIVEQQERNEQDASPSKKKNMNMSVNYKNYLQEKAARDEAKLKISYEEFDRAAGTLEDALLTTFEAARSEIISPILECCQAWQCYQKLRLACSNPSREEEEAGHLEEDLQRLKRKDAESILCHCLSNVLSLVCLDSSGFSKVVSLPEGIVSSMQEERVMREKEEDRQGNPSCCALSQKVASLAWRALEGLGKILNVYLEHPEDLHWDLSNNEGLTTAVEEVDRHFNQYKNFFFFSLSSSNETLGEQLNAAHFFLHNILDCDFKSAMENSEPAAILAIPPLLVCYCLKTPGTRSLLTYFCAELAQHGSKPFLEFEGLERQYWELVRSGGGGQQRITVATATASSSSLTSGTAFQQEVEEVRCSSHCRTSCHSASTALFRHLVEAFLQSEDWGLQDLDTKQEVTLAQAIHAFSFYFQRGRNAELWNECLAVLLIP